eukprot:CAMPEP_0194199786 /NCGR_PEP_ID=MMETSP0156-20130528/666_1 /TAXON_ID=33649 /ORGANISM="Thalassionema nitzschioides, Strain L26-B" /LENGTH=628 /DNA_ID=CAMNT_0038924723 /DNA_START=60 /DNA_END=1946 /DNA_ORIENTATION=+
MRVSKPAVFSNVFLAQLYHSQAWLVPQSCRVARDSRRSATSLAALIAPDTATSSFSIEGEGESVVEGTIVSYFAGGLAAVKVGNDSFLSTIADLKGQTDKSKTQTTGDDLLGRLAKLPCGTLGVVIAQRPPLVFVYGRDTSVEKIDGTVEIFGTMAEISVSDEMSIVNALGEPAPSNSWGNHAIFSPIPKVSDIALINAPRLTGTTIVDVLAPIGKGQNMLIVGSDVTQMRDLSFNFLKTQSGVENTKCIYAITQDCAAVMEKLEKDGLLESVIVVAARDGIESETAKAAEAITVASTACAIAESFAKDRGQDAVVVVDNLDYHKQLWDETTRILVDIYGVDAVVAADRDGGASSEMRAFYSTLIQRAANYNEKQGGGSVTLAIMTTMPKEKADDDTIFNPEDFALAGDRIKTRIETLVSKNIPLTAATLRKIQIPVPSASEGKRRLALQHVEDLISMSDGQIWLDEKLIQAGRSPPLDPKRSITRIGVGADTESRADAPAIRRIVEGVRLELQQAASMDGAELTNASKKQRRRGEAWFLAMNQEPSEGARSLAETCVALLAASSGVLDDVVEAGGIAGSEAGRTTVKELIEHVRSRTPGGMDNINKSLDLSPAVRKEIEEAIASYFN